MQTARRLASAALLGFICLISITLAQTESATIRGRVTDASNAVVQGAEIQIRSEERGTVRNSVTNSSGIYFFPAVQPGRYDLTVQHAGFRRVDVLGLIVNVQDHVDENFKLQVGSAIESVTVNAEVSLVNIQDATVSTVIDRTFADNLPMNGRSFQTLIELTPGVVLAAGNSNANGFDTGQFNVNGQRAASNYWLVDGVSANVGSSTGFGGNSLSGAGNTLSVLGGTNSLVSVDALQEFRIQTSTFAPEFGRTPGAQISILTRSGSNQIHGSAFDYLRNDVFDANNWFNGVNILNPVAISKAKERVNDFGGTFGGAILRDRTFFFFSYEGLRLRLPNTTLTTVPDLGARQNAVPAMQPFLNAFPLDPRQPDLGNGLAQFNASYSDPSTLDAYSLRLDHKYGEKLAFFGRYNYSPSSITQRALNGNALSSLFYSRINTQTATVGSTWAISNTVFDESRFNYSSSNAIGREFLDDFGGAIPLTTLPFPSPYTAQNGLLVVLIQSLQQGNVLGSGAVAHNLQRQFNLTNTVTQQRGSHNLKFGVDYRYLLPIYDPQRYQQTAIFRDVLSTEAGTLRVSRVTPSVGATLSFTNISAFAQDTWRVLPRFTLTYGLRWDTDFAPSTTSGPALVAVTGFDLANLSQLALAPPGTSSFKTTYANFAPRVGVAYEINQNQNMTTVVRGGAGLFYDLATSETANLIRVGGYPFSSPLNDVTVGGTFPLNPAAAAPPPIEAPTIANPGSVGAFDPNLKLPYALQWNVALEQSLGENQSFSATYIGSIGRRLLQSLQVLSPNASLNQATLVTNIASSDYDALQLQFQRRMLKGLQALASYTWAHSIDTASAGSFGNGSNLISSAANATANRGDSDFDIRNALSVGVTYTLPSWRSNLAGKVMATGWSLDGALQTRSAPPVDVFNSSFSQLTSGFISNVRPDLAPGVPLYLYGPQFPGGKAINNTPGAVAGGCPDGTPSIGPFCNPPVDANGNPLRQGNLGRNVFRGFGATQLDLAAHRDFPIHESLSLQFRAEAFNVLNHPNFGAPLGDLGQPQFGLSSQMLGASLSSSAGSGGFNPLFQQGGPRSLQFSLKISF